MAKKVKKGKPPLRPASSSWRRSVTRPIRSGSRDWALFPRRSRKALGLFNSLVKEGAEVQKRTKQAAGDTVADIRGRVADIRDSASGAWDKLENVFEQRVARALHSLNVPTKKDIDHLSRRVAELTSVANKLSTTMSHQKHH